MSDEETRKADVPVEQSLNGHGRAQLGTFQQGSPGAGLVFIATVSGITWVAGFVVITIWSVAGYLLFRGAEEGSRAGVDFIANGIYYGFPLGSLAGLWLGTKTGLRLIGEPRSGTRFRVGMLGGLISLALIMTALMIALMQEGPIRLGGLPIVGPILAILGLIAPGVGVSIGRALADRRRSKENPVE